MLRLKSILLISIFSIIFSFSAPIYSNNLNIILNKKVNFDVPEKSGQVYNMPWINDDDFLNAKEKYDTPILIAGFCSVLVDPYLEKNTMLHLLPKVLMVM